MCCWPIAHQTRTIKFSSIENTCIQTQPSKFKSSVNYYRLWTKIKTAIELEFPLTNHYDCYFHMSQEVLRYVNQNGFLINARENTNFAENFRLRCISSLFPSNEIQILVSGFITLSEGYNSGLNSKIPEDCKNFFLSLYSSDLKRKEIFTG